MAAQHTRRISPNIKRIGKRFGSFLAIALAGMLLVAGIVNGRSTPSGETDEASAAALNQSFARGNALVSNLRNNDEDGGDDGVNKEEHNDDGVRGGGLDTDEDEDDKDKDKDEDEDEDKTDPPGEAPENPQADEILEEDFDLVQQVIEDRDEELGNDPNGSFMNLCVINHTNQDNFITSPEQVAAAQHTHQYFGNETTNAFSTPENLLSDESSECQNEADTSAFWVPALLVDGEPVEPEISAFIMRGYNEDVGEVAPMPRGLAMITGDAKATDPDDSNAQFACTDSINDRSKEFPDCDDDEQLVRIQDFPSCWDGENLDSEDHREHVVFTEGGECPESNPVPLPRLRYVFVYDGGADADDLELSSFPEAEGLSFSDHADFLNLLPTEQMLQGVQECINAGQDCGTLAG
jgi:Domain of unknown function (DUF1996)